MKSHSITAVIGAILLSTVSASAHDRSELNGSWTLVPAKSDFAGQPVVQTGTVTISDRQGIIIVTRSFVSAHRQLAPDSWARLNDDVLMGASLAGQGQFAEAEPLLVNGYAALEKQMYTIPKTERHCAGVAGGWVVQFYRNWGKPDKAAEWARKLQNTNAGDPK